MSASFNLSFRNGFGFDLELTPKQFAIGVSEENEEDIYPVMVQAMQLRLPLLAFEAVFVERGTFPEEEEV